MSRTQLIEFSSCEVRRLTWALVTEIHANPLLHFWDEEGEMGRGWGEEEEEEEEEEEGELDATRKNIITPLDKC